MSEREITMKDVVKALKEDRVGQYNEGGWEGERERDREGGNRREVVGRERGSEGAKVSHQLGERGRKGGQVSQQWRERRREGG